MYYVIFEIIKTVFDARGYGIFYDRNELDICIQLILQVKQSLANNLAWFYDISTTILCNI